MLLESNEQRKINLKINLDEYCFNFSNFFDQDAKDFEEKKVRKKVSRRLLIHDDADGVRDISWTNLTYWQSYHYLEHQRDSYYILQMSNLHTDSHYQVAVKVEISKIRFFSFGTIEKWAVDTSEETLKDIKILLDKLIDLLRKYTFLTSLRVQPYMPGEKHLDVVSTLLFEKGFSDVAPKSYVKTRMIDLRPSVDEMLSFFSANGRVRLKIKDKEKNRVEVKEISETSFIPFLQNALDQSYQRSAARSCPFDFAPFFKSRKHYDGEVAMFGFFFKDSPLVPRAFISGVNHGNVSEYSVGGSINDPLLRHFPFNHILMWKLALHSKLQGCELLDMGGVTSGDDSDPLRGISRFKRLFPGFEIATGAEMEIVFNPNFKSLYLSLHKYALWINRKLDGLKK